MCKHYWMLGMTTLDGTPGECKKCHRRRVFRTQGLTWETSKEARRRPHEPRPSRVSHTELPFNPHGYMGKLAGSRRL